MLPAQITSGAMTAAVTLAIWEMDSFVKISMNAMRPIQYTTVTLMRPVTTQMEVLHVHVTVDTLEMVSPAVSSVILYSVPLSVVKSFI